MMNHMAIIKRLTLILIFIAPVLQIFLSGLRIKGKIKLPVIAIAAIEIPLGITLSVLEGQLIDYIHPSTDHLPASLEFAFIGTGISVILAPIIYLISYIVYLHRQASTS